LIEYNANLNEYKIFIQLKQGMTKVFKIISKYYNEGKFSFFFFLPCGGVAAFRKICVKFANIKDGDRILDLCCGKGALIKAIHKQGTKVQLVGVDNSASAIEEARTKTKFIPVTLIKASADNLPLNSSQYDKCYISWGLHHMSSYERKKALGEVYRILVPEGNLYIIDYNLPERGLKRLVSIFLIKLDESKETFKMLKNGNMVKEIVNAGFEIKKQSPVCHSRVKLIEAIKI